MFLRWQYSVLTPGVSWVSCQKERPFNGMFCTVCVSMTWPTDEEAWLSNGVWPLYNRDFVAHSTYLQDGVDSLTLC
jgi:hypothetical protein